MINSDYRQVRPAGFSMLWSLSKGLALFISEFTCAEKGCILDHGYKLSNDYSAEYRGKGNRQLMVLLVAQ